MQPKAWYLRALRCQRAGKPGPFPILEFLSKFSLSFLAEGVFIKNKLFSGTENMQTKYTKEIHPGVPHLYFFPVSFQTSIPPALIYSSDSLPTPPRYPYFQTIYHLVLSSQLQHRTENIPPFIGFTGNLRRRNAGP